MCVDYSFLSFMRVALGSTVDGRTPQLSLIWLVRIRVFLWTSPILSAVTGCRGACKVVRRKAFWLEDTAVGSGFVCIFV